MMDVRAQMWIILFITAIATAVGIEEDNSTSHLIPCKEGWYLFGEKCYKVFGHKTPLKWTEAAEICVMGRGHLASIHTQALQDFLTSFFVLNEQSSIWIGLKRETIYEDLHEPYGFRTLHHKIVFEWHDGSIVNYTSWDRDEPISKGGELVYYVSMALKARSKPGMWYGFPSEAKKLYICQSDKSEEANSLDPRFCALEKGGGWKYLNSCYHIVTEEKSWDDAEKYCHQNLDGHLVSILNNKNNIFLSYILSSADLDFWIGVKMRDRELQVWSSGWHAVFNKWDDDQEFTKGKCGLITKYGHWISVDCIEKRPFVCEVSSNKPPVYEQGEEGWKCPDSSKDWKDLDGDTCYIFETEQSFGWYEANYACMTKGGALASIRSEVESETLHPHVIGTQNRLLIGLHRKPDNKTAFQWMDGSEVNFDNWYTGEPNNIDEECVELWTRSMIWNDIPCDQAKGYICSAKKLPPNLYDEEPLSQGDIKTEKCDCQSDITAQTVVITMVCSFSVMILIGIMAYFYKTRIAKDIQFSRLQTVFFNRP